MTRLEELKAAWFATSAAACDAADVAWYAHGATWAAYDAAWYAYYDELKKIGED
jgi:hypothetical protein